ncbi:MAG: amino acid decarboxylase [Eubacterium sp.]|nr:amino acid decarboxylase [Eubacterium sp.]
MKLHEELKKLDKYPFHMPGHKRNSDFDITGSDIDITEISGFDNLHEPKGLILETEKRLAKTYKSKKSFMLVNGSTVGILSAIFGVCSEGDKIIIARNCHKSVYNACMLRHLRVVYLEPEYDYVNSYYLSITQDALDGVISRNPDAVAVVITNPTYEGRISNISCPLPLIVDAAHGAHLGFYNFPNYPKGDIVISSLHKTLPALTQTAVMNIYNEKYISAAKRYLDIFETSSPSYVLMSSVSKCLDITESRKLFKSYYDMLCDLREIDLYSLRLKYSDDISKIIISTENTNITGKELADILRDKYSIEPELASLNYIILMTSVGDTKEGFDRLKSALYEIDETLIQCNETISKKPPVPIGESIIEYPEYTKETELNNSIGKKAGEFVFAYPPDIPVIVPGEVITREAVDYIKSAFEKGVNIISDSSLLPNSVLTKDD